MQTARQAARPLDRTRPALVIDGGARGDIGVVRSLGMGRVPIHLLASNPNSTTTASRFVTAVHAFPPSSAPAEQRVARLREIARSMAHRPVILAAGDSSLRFLSENRGAFEDVVDHDLAPAELLSTCLDKDRFAVAAERLGLPVPTTFAPRDPAEVEERAPGLRYPVFVKPVHREAWDKLPAGVVQQVKGQRVDSAGELVHLSREIYRHNPEGHRMVVQTMVQGDDSEHMSVHAYLDRSHNVVGAFTGKKLRIWPPHAGVGAMVTSKIMPGPLKLALDSLQALQYTGFAILQFKRDVRTDRYELLEINCRYSTWTELPSRAGCNFPLAAYATMTGQPAPPIRQREGVSWLDFERDLGSMSAYRQSQEWTWTGYVRSLSSVRCWAFFAWDDPRPLLRKLVSSAS